ncbi:hypothetical protein GLW08_06565 [Pontibacillus yanchengensis]|uniref:Uncharacterized protein n=2 Tax=Pontibacillus yanchengensis TaxID=462910 RepID=A0A6I5A2X0_9BACI|nr:hypothetical protein [Pontibacillus yanchengensis]MYL32419.1 hypothetical protein [Pontibacillus yanchengensis]MYL53000.1 hypothetical protein [Pontibacillus yanchengensis]
MNESNLRKQALTEVHEKVSQQETNNFLFNYGTLAVTLLALLVDHLF